MQLIRRKEFQSRIYGKNLCMESWQSDSMNRVPSSLSRCKSPLTPPSDKSVSLDHERYESGRDKRDRDRDRQADFYGHYEAKFTHTIVTQFVADLKIVHRQREFINYCRYLNSEQGHRVFPI